MFTAKHFRAKAAESAEALKHADVPSEIREFQRSEESFNALAENEDWLANNFDKIVHSEEEGAAGKPVADATVAEIEERILRCLGAAVILQWNTIPNEASARTLRYRRLNGGRAEFSRAERADCPLPA